MGKKFKYKGFSKVHSLICVNVVAMILLGISYGHWSNILIVNTEVSTGELSVEGTIDEIASSPISVEIVKLEQSTPGYYKGSADIIFSVENTGDVAALISLNKNVTGNPDKNVGINFINGDTILSECLIPVESKKFNVTIVDQESTVISETLWDVEEFLLGIGERATVTLKECEFEVALSEGLGQLEIETQVSLAYKDRTGAWYGDTSNSLYIRQPLSELYDITTFEVMVPPLMPGVEIPVTIPSDGEGMIVGEEPGVEIPVTIPSDGEDVIIGEESGTEIPVTIPSDEADVITKEEVGTGIPIISPSDTVLEETVEGAILIE